MSTVNPELVDLLKKSRSILVFTGAGVSTGSGIADYRGPQGVWKTKEPVYFEDFMTNPGARVEYWEQKLEVWPQIRDATPNDTHRAIVRLEQAEKVTAVVTQNIDGLHEKAGTTLERLIEVHGTNLKVECMSCHDRSEADEHFRAFAETRSPPLCLRCGGFLKPATISFGQSLDPRALERAWWAARRADLVVALGSSLTVQPAASIPLAAAERGAPYVIINRGITEHDGLAGVRLRLDGDVTEVFPAAVATALESAQS
jgi:NAD-dependent deacetylase